LHHYFSVNSCGSNDDGDGGDSKLDARCTSNMRDRCNSTNDMAENSSTACNIRRDNIQSKSTPDSHNSRRQSRLLQFLEFRRKFERQNSARERKPIHLPPIQLREAFSLFSLSSCLSLFVFLLLGRWKLLLRSSTTH